MDRKKQKYRLKRKILEERLVDLDRELHQMKKSFGEQADLVTLTLKVREFSYSGYIIEFLFDVVERMRNT